jgi:hypothetical protein
MTRSLPSVRPALLAVLAALCLAAPAVAPGRPPTPARAEPDPLAPADSGLLVTVNVRQLAAAPLVQKYARAELARALARTERVGKALQAAGLDPLRDVDTVALAVSGDLLHPHVLAVVRGRFDPEKAQAAAAGYARSNPAELQIEGTGGGAVYRFRAEHHEVFAAFDGGAVVMATTREHLAAALRSATGRPAPVAAPMQAALGKLTGKECAWLALVIAEPMKEALKRKDPQSAGLIASLESVTGGIEVTDAFRLELTAHTVTPEAAAQLRKKMDDVLPLLQFFAAADDAGARLLRDAVAGIKVDNQRGAVRVALQVSEEMIQKAMRPPSPSR